MMWQGEWLEEARKTKYGNLTREEAEALWEKWLKDDKVPRDDKGPRGFIRLWVKTRDQISYFDELSKQKSLNAEEKLGKNPGEAALNARRNFLTGSAGFEKHENALGNFDAVKDKAAHAMCSRNDASESAFDGEGVLGADVENLLENAQAKMRKRTEFISRSC